MNELSLVFFTVFSQSAIGLALIAFVGGAINERSREAARRANLFSLALIAIALIAGILHLGRLFRAPNMLLALGESPMSVEIFLCCAFSALIAGSLFFAYIKKNAAIEFALNLAAACAGAAFAWSIANVYMIESVESWNSWRAAAQMCATVFVGGGAFAILLGLRAAGGAVLLFGAGVSLLLKADYFNFINSVSSQSASEQTLFWSVWIVCLAAAIGSGSIALAGETSKRRVIAAGAIAAIAGEISARIAFYNLWAIAM